MTGDKGRMISTQKNIFCKVNLISRSNMVIHKPILDSMKYKFEGLDVWKISLDLVNKVYMIIEHLPKAEKFNIISQITRAATSISLNIAEGSTSQSNNEQSRFLGYAIRSLIEVIACIRIIEIRGYINDPKQLANLEDCCDKLFIKLQAFKKSLK